VGLHTGIFEFHHPKGLTKVPVPSVVPFRRSVGAMHWHVSCMPSGIEEIADSRSTSVLFVERRASRVALN